MPINESLPLLNPRANARNENFEKDPDDLNVGIDIRKLRKVYRGETGKQ